MYSDTRPFAIEREVALAPVSRPPLVLDLDGTLLHTNLLLECALLLLRRRPLALFRLVAWLFAGRAVLKRRLAERVRLAVDVLPVNAALVEHARQAHADGREVFVASAADEALARQVAARFPFVSGVIASDGSTNLKGMRKAAALAERFPGGFVYAGDATADLPVWQQASAAVFAGRSARLHARVRRLGPVEAAVPAPAPGLRTWMRATRLHQWAKNGLLLVPAVLAGRMLVPATVLNTAGAWVAMGLVASATYLVNDLFDLESDRRHWTKRHRPLAAGVIPIPQAVAASAALIAAGIALAALIGGAVLAGLCLLYCAVTLGYSFHLKRVPVLDVAILAGLFTLRLVIGAAASAVTPSTWLLVFSMFLFLSLALAKRAGELARARLQGLAGEGEAALHGRGYVAADAPFLQALGVASAVTSVLILVLYLVDEAFPGLLYSEPRLLWSVPVLVGLWLGRVWLLCGRGQLADDPVLFALRDRTSLLLGLGVAGGFLAAALVP